MSPQGFSLGAFVAYGNANTTFQDALKADWMKNADGMGWPNKAEAAGVIKDYTMRADATLTATVPLIPQFMADENRAFNLPSPNPKKITPGSVKLVHVDTKTKEGTISFGEKKGDTYKSTTTAHTEFKVKNNRDAFKK